MTQDREEWDARWREGRIGFHEGRPNARLVAHLEALRLARGARLFLPLCGKTVDIDWLLEGGFAVAGIEFNAGAVAEVFDRLGLTPEITETGDLTRWQAGYLTL